MSQIIWNDSYSVNNASLDAQHQDWIEIHNRLDHLLLNGDDQDFGAALFESVQTIQEWVYYHFRQEEEYMRQINFPTIVEHKRLHTEFQDWFFNYYRRITNGELVLITEIITITKNWLHSHILHEDAKYARFRAAKED
jgi:hemerythrin-like metal-binding protein